MQPLCCQGRAFSVVRLSTLKQQANMQTELSASVHQSLHQWGADADVTQYQTRATRSTSWCVSNRRLCVPVCVQQTHDVRVCVAVRGACQSVPPPVEVQV